METQKIHYNQAQLNFFVSLARLSVVIYGRATGKTEGITSLWLLGNLIAMPRSVGALIVPADKGSEKILAGLWKGFEKFGYREGEHYVIGIKPPKAWKKKGYNAPRKKFENYVSFFNGSGFYILSAKSKHNGANLDFLAVEEAKLIDETFFRETYLCVRGNEDKFGGLSNHGSLLLVTDRPRPEDSQIVYAFELEAKSPLNQRRLKALLFLYSLIGKLKQAIAATTDVKTIKELQKQLKKYLQKQNTIRCKTIFYGESSTLENIHALGIDKIKEFKKTLTREDFAISVLNKKPAKVENAFYALFNPKRHAYYDHEDIRQDQALHLGFDYNANICCLEVVQYYQNQFKVVRTLEVKRPEHLDHLLAQFIEQFGQHTTRTIYYYFDPSAKQGANANSVATYYDTITHYLRKHRFNVVEKYTKKASTHDERYRLYLRLFSGKDAKLPIFSYNAHYCYNLAMSLARAGTVITLKDGKSITGKDKRPELDKTLNQSYTTHHSEALDSIVMGLLAKPLTIAI